MDIIYDRLETRNEFMEGDEAAWDLSTTVIPYNFIIFVTDTHKIKKGDGVKTFAELPVWIDLDAMPTGNTNGTPAILGALPPAGSENKIVIVDATGKYKASSLSLSTVLNTMNSADLSNDSQDEDINALNALCLLIDVLVPANQNKIMIINGGKYKPSSYTLESLNNAIKLEASIILGITLSDVRFYTDASLLNRVYVLSENTTYYAKIFAADENHLAITYGLTEDSLSVVINPTANAFIKEIVVDNLSQDSSVTFTATVSNGTKTKTMTKVMPILSFKLINGRYNGAIEDEFKKVAMDKDGNFIAVGKTSSEGLGGTSALIVKFDKDLSIVNKKIYGGESDDAFEDIIVDGVNNYIAVGWTKSSGLGLSSGLIIKFDENLSSDYPIISAKIYGSAEGNEAFYGITRDNSNNYYVCGYTSSLGAKEDGALVIKFSSALAILAKKVYGDSSSVCVFNSIALDVNLHVVAVGNYNDTQSAAAFGIIVKFNNTLASVLGAKSFSGEGIEKFNAIKVGTGNFYYVAGYTTTEATGTNDCLLLKINQDLTLVNKKRYGGINIDEFKALHIDTLGNIYLVGVTETDQFDMLILKLNASLVIVAEKTISGVGKEELFGIMLDKEGNLICSGRQGNLVNLGAYIAKINPTLEVGIYSGVEIDCIYQDVALTFEECSENFTYSDWIKVMVGSELTLLISTLTLAESNLNYVKESIV